MSFIKILSNANEDPAYETMKAELAKYCTEKSAGTVQGGAEWKLSRALLIEYGEDKPTVYITVGGSELASVLRQNKFRSYEALIHDKVTLLTTGGDREENTPDRALRTEWGHVLEPYSREFIMGLYGTTFIEISASIPHHSVKSFRLSPDGVGIVRVSICDSAPRLAYAVLELKNPYDRIAQNTVPVYYMSQVLAGCDIIQIAELGLYAECNFRAQSLSNIGTGRYNGWIHSRSSINGKKGPERYQDLTCHCSIIAMFYTDLALMNDVFSKQDSEAAEVRELRALHNLCLGEPYWHIDRAERSIIDFGATNDLIMQHLMFAISRGIITHWTEQTPIFSSELAAESAEEQIATFIKWCDENGKHAFGIMPATLYKYSSVVVPKQTDYIEKIRPQIEEFTGLVKGYVNKIGLHQSFMNLIMAKKNSQPPEA